MLTPIKFGPARLAVSIYMDNGVRLIQLSGPFQFHNRTLIPLQILYQKQWNDDGPVLSVVPGGHAVFPVGLIDSKESSTTDTFKSLYRFYNKKLRQHFFTTDTADIMKLPSTGTWLEECAIGYVHTTFKIG